MQKKEESSPELWATPLTILIAGAMVTSAILMSGAGNGEISKRVIEKKEAPAKADVAPADPDDPFASAAVKEILKVTKDDHIRGPKDAAVTIIEYSDMECPFCGRFHTSMKQLVEERDDVRWVYRNFPLSFHKNAAPAAEAGECIADVAGEDAYWEYTDAVFNAGSLAGDGIMNVVRGISGVDADKVSACIEKGTFKALVAQQTRDAQTTGGSGTPWSIMIGPDGKAEGIRGARAFSSLMADVDRLVK